MDRVEFNDVCSFFGFQEGEYKHRLAVEGEKLWNTLFERNREFGGWFVEITGLMGRGKTSLMLTMADKIFREYPDELVFWREGASSPIQAPKIGDNFKLLVERGYRLGLYELGETRPIKSDKYDITYFKGYLDLIKHSEPGILNVVFFKDLQKWLGLLSTLRQNTRFQTILIDEMEDITPARCSKETGNYWTNEAFANRLKEIRKSRINLIYNTQAKTDVEWRLRSKIMMHIYLPGSRTDDESPVYKKMIQGLNIGEAVIDLGFSLFGKLSFGAYKPMDKLYSLIPTDSRGRINYGTKLG